MQQNTWLGDMCDEVRRVVLIEGDTMIIPAGYIHAVVSGIERGEWLDTDEGVHADELDSIWRQLCPLLRYPGSITPAADRDRHKGTSAISIPTL